MRVTRGGGVRGGSKIGSARGRGRDVRMKERRHGDGGGWKKGEMIRLVTRRRQVMRGRSERGGRGKVGQERDEG